MSEHESEMFKREFVKCHEVIKGFFESHPCGEVQELKMYSDGNGGLMCDHCFRLLSLFSRNSKKPVEPLSFFRLVASSEDINDFYNKSHCLVD